MSIMTLLTAVPGAMFSYLESVAYLEHVEPGSYFLVKLVSGVETLTSNIIIDLPVGLILTTANIVFHSVRYRPLLNVIYSANSVQAHLAALNSQIMSTSRQFVFRDPRSSALIDNLDRFDLASSGPREVPTVWSSVGAVSATEMGPTGGSLRQHSTARASTTASSKSFRDELLVTESCISGSSVGYPTCSPISSGHLSLRGSAFENSVFAQGDVPSKAKLTSASSGTISRLGLAGNVEDPEERQAVWAESGLVAHFAKRRKPVCVIRNLHQLEHHLTRLSLFVGDMDQCAAEVVCAMCFLVFIQFIYSVFFLVEVAKHFPGYLMVLFVFVCVLTQLTIPLRLFLSGDRMEKEAKRLLANLELIYLQDSSQCLIYKQHGSHMMASLARTIELLKTIRFNCDSTMNIDLATLKRFLLYLMTTIFIVVQYGKC